MERVRLSQLVHTRQASRSSSTIQKHTSNHTPRAVRMNDGEKEEALLVRSLRSTASQLWRKHQASPPVEFHTPRLRPKRASFSKRLPRVQPSRQVRLQEHPTAACPFFCCHEHATWTILESSPTCSLPFPQGHAGQKPAGLLTYFSSYPATSPRTRPCFSISLSRVFAVCTRAASRAV